MSDECILTTSHRVYPPERNPHARHAIRVDAGAVDSVYLTEIPGHSLALVLEGEHGNVTVLGTVEEVMALLWAITRADIEMDQRRHARAAGKVPTAS